MKVFISGKVTGMPNGNHFDEAEAYLKSLGHETINPWHLYKVYGGDP